MRRTLPLALVAARRWRASSAARGEHPRGRRADAVRERLGDAAPSLVARLARRGGRARSRWREREYARRPARAAGRRTGRARSSSRPPWRAPAGCRSARTTTGLAVAGAPAWTALCGSPLPAALERRAARRRADGRAPGCWYASSGRPTRFSPRRAPTPRSRAAARRGRRSRRPRPRPPCAPTCSTPTRRACASPSSTRPALATGVPVAPRSRPRSPRASGTCSRRLPRAARAPRPEAADRRPTRRARPRRARRRTAEVTTLVTIARRSASTRFRAAPLSPREQRRRAGQLRTLHAARAGRVRPRRRRRPGDCATSRSRRRSRSATARASAFGDLRADAARARRGRDAPRSRRSLDAARRADLEAAAQRQAVADPDGVEAHADGDPRRHRRRSSRRPGTSPTRTADFDVIAGLARPACRGRRSAGQYGIAEQARLEAYAFFEFGPGAAPARPRARASSHAVEGSSGTAPAATTGSRADRPPRLARRDRRDPRRRSTRRWARPRQASAPGREPRHASSPTPPSSSSARASRRSSSWPR